MEKTNWTYHDLDKNIWLKHPLKCLLCGIMRATFLRLLETARAAIFHYVLQTVVHHLTMMLIHLVLLSSSTMFKWHLNGKLVPQSASTNDQSTTNYKPTLKNHTIRSHPYYVECLEIMYIVIWHYSNRLNWIELNWIKALNGKKTKLICIIFCQFSQNWVISCTTFGWNPGHSCGLLRRLIILEQSHLLICSTDIQKHN